MLICFMIWDLCTQKIAKATDAYLSLILSIRLSQRHLHWFVFLLVRQESCQVHHDFVRPIP